VLGLQLVEILPQARLAGPKDQQGHEEETAMKPTARDVRLLTLYGIVDAERREIMYQQGNRCAVCGLEPKKMTLNADHDHRSGILRGFVCYRCNRGLAVFRDDPALLARAAGYLREDLATSAIGRVCVGRTGRSTRKWRTKREQRERMAWVVHRLADMGYEVPKRLRKWIV